VTPPFVLTFVIIILVVILMLILVQLRVGVCLLVVGMHSKPLIISSHDVMLLLYFLLYNFFRDSKIAQ